MEIDIAEEVKGSEEASLDMNNYKKRANDEAITQLHEHLRCMVNNPACSDVVFVCNDGVRVHALRNLLVGRSEMLKGMLINGMAESNLSEIELAEFDSPVMLSVLEFVYAGNLLDHRPLNWTRAFKTLKASQFFLLPLLADIVRSSLYAGTGSIAQDLTKVAALLTEALGYRGLWDEKDIVLMELVSILRSNWLDTDFVGNLSEDALHYLLANTKCERNNVDELSFYEYNRFRQLIRWWVHHTDLAEPSATEELVNLTVPDKEHALAMCKYPERSETVTCPEDGTLLSNECASFRANETIKHAVIRLMPTIDCRKIHPALLAKVVDPLEIVSSAEMVLVYRFHALRRPMVFKESSLRWGHGESYRALEQGHVIERAGALTGPAILLAAMSRSMGTYHWCFVVEIVPATYYELGFVYNTSASEADLPASTRLWLCKQRCARVMSTWVGASKVDMCRVKEAENGERELWKDLSHTISIGGRADFFYNAHDRTCSLALNGQDCGIIWKDLPRAIYYPAVSLGQSSRGRVRVELVSGFDIL